MNYWCFGKKLNQTKMHLYDVLQSIYQRLTNAFKYNNFLESNDNFEVLRKTKFDKTRYKS